MSIEFRLRDFAYPAAILRLRRYFEKSQYFSPERMEQDQLKRLRAILIHAWKYIPYYKKKMNAVGIRPEDIRNITDFYAFPKLTKEDILGNFPQLVASNSERFMPREERTSGSTGIPCRFLSDKFSRALEFSFYWRHWSWAGYRLGQRFAELSSHYFAAHPKRTGDLYTHESITGRLYLNSLRISPDSALLFVQALNKHRARYLKGVASALFYLAHWILKNDIEDVRLEAVLSTGEILPPHYRKTISEAFHCNVMDTYGQMERVAAISQCPEGGYHINSDYGILELEKDKALPNGGRVIGTSLYNYAMPLIRYEVGDLVEEYDKPRLCSCGRALPLVKSIKGRKEDVVVTPDGRVITSIYISLNFVKGFSFGQFIQEDMRSLLVNLIKGPEFQEGASEKFLTVLRGFVGPDMDIRLKYVTHGEIFLNDGRKVRIVKSKLNPEEW
jgi:phenylacetate-CoA ligase